MASDRADSTLQVADTWWGAGNTVPRDPSSRGCHQAVSQNVLNRTHISILVRAVVGQQISVIA